MWWRRRLVENKNGDWMGWITSHPRKKGLLFSSPLAFYVITTLYLTTALSVYKGEDLKIKPAYTYLSGFKE